MSQITIKGRCPMCGNEWSVKVDEVNYQSFKEGDMLAQEAFPELTPAERELLITGFCDDCWEEFAKYEEELEEESTFRDTGADYDIDKYRVNSVEDLPK